MHELRPHEVHHMPTFLEPYELAPRRVGVDAIKDLPGVGHGDQAILDGMQKQHRRADLRRLFPQLLGGIAVVAADRAPLDLGALRDTVDLFVDERLRDRIGREAHASTVPIRSPKGRSIGTDKVHTPSIAIVSTPGIMANIMDAWAG